MNNEMTYATPQTNSHRQFDEITSPSVPTGALLTAETAQQMMAEMRRDMDYQIQWQIQQHLATRRGPSPSEALLALGSLAAGAVITSVLVTHSTTVVQGLLGTQTTTQMNIWPFVVVVWLALFAVNFVWARRR